jgi:hypothetical protein
MWRDYVASTRPSQPRSWPTLSAGTVPLASLTKVEPSPLLKNNLLELLYAYVFTTLQFNGDWTTQVHAVACVRTCVRACVRACESAMCVHVRERECIRACACTRMRSYDDRMSVRARGLMFSFALAYVRTPALVCVARGRGLRDWLGLQETDALDSVLSVSGVLWKGAVHASVCSRAFFSDGAGLRWYRL